MTPRIYMYKEQVIDRAVRAGRARVHACSHTRTGYVTRRRHVCARCATFSFDLESSRKTAYYGVHPNEIQS